MSNTFIVGEIYFRVTYADPAMKFPLIQSFVFVGRNLSDEDTEDIWYFQFADSYGQHGPITKAAGGDRRVACLSKGDLDEMLDEARLWEEFHAARTRRLLGSKG